MFKKLFGKKDKNQEENQLEKPAEISIEIDQEKGITKFVREGYNTEEDNAEFLRTLSEKNNIPTYKGEIKHAYESDFLGYKNKCPRCDSPTKQMMSNFPYATQEEARILTAPAGHFCPNCPTVIIDDDMMRQSIDPRFKYHGVFNVETGSNQGLLTTLNGEKPVYILTEDQDIAGIAQSVQQNMDTNEYIYVKGSGKPKLSAATQQKRKSGNKKKKKAARKARKKNRRK